MNSTSFFSELLTTIADRGRSVLPRSWVGTPIGARADLVQLARDLVSRRGEASGVALAREIFTRWDALEASERREFLIHLVEEFGADALEREQSGDLAKCHAAINFVILHVSRHAGINGIS